MVSWLEPTPSRYCTESRMGNSLRDRSNNTRSERSKAGCNRSSRNPDRSPTRDNRNKSTLGQGRSTTSRSARHASHGTSCPRGHRQNRRADRRHGR